jgi:hypothetical protein
MRLADGSRTVSARAPRTHAPPAEAALRNGGRRTRAFIGAVHRRAAELDGLAELVAGAFSSIRRSRAPTAGRCTSIRRASTRATRRWPSGEAARPAGDRIDFVVIVTPNHLHYPVAQRLHRARLPRDLRQADDHHARRRRGTLPAGRGARRGVRAHAQLLRLPDGEAGARPHAQGALGHAAQGDGGVHAGLALHGARGDGDRSRPTGAPTRPGPGPARSATSARTPSSWRATSPACEMERLLADVSTVVEGRRWTTMRTCCSATRAARAASCTARRSRWARRTGSPCASTARTVAGVVARRTRTLLTCAADGPTAGAHKPGHALPGAGRAARHAPALGHPEAFFEAFANVYGNACAPSPRVPAKSPTRSTSTSPPCRTARSACTSSRRRRCAAGSGRIGWMRRYPGVSGRRGLAIACQRHFFAHLLARLRVARPVPSRSSPASGPTCRSRRWPRRPRVGLRRPRARLLGRPLRRGARALRGRLLPSGSATCSRSTGSRSTPSATTSSGRRCATDRRAAPEHPAAARLGRRRSRGGAAARRRGDAGHGARGRALGVKVVPGFTGSSIWPCSTASRRCPTSGSTRATATSPTAGTRSSTSSTRWACASRSRCTPPRSPSTSRPPSGPSSAIGHREAFGFNYDPSHFGYQGVDYSPSSSVRRPHLPRAHEGRLVERAVPRRERRVRRAPGVRPPRPALGLPLHRPRARSTSRRIVRALNRVGYDGPALGGVGGHRHGPRVRRARGVRPPGFRFRAPVRACERRSLVSLLN